MELKSNIAETINKLERIKTSLGNGNVPPIPDFSDAMFSALNSGMGFMKRRIFTKGEDAEGIPLGSYHGSKTRLTGKRLSIHSEDEFEEKERKTRKKAVSRLVKTSPDDTYTEYEKFRVSKGRQIGYKDLEVEGSLRRSIETIKTDYGHVVIAITNGESANIAFYQEKQVGNIRAGVNANIGNAPPAKIFVLSEPEFEQVKTEGERLISEVVKNLFK